jgi:hypothetical protein
MTDQPQQRWQYQSVRFAAMACGVAALAVAIALFGLYVQGTRIEELEKHQAAADLASARMAAEVEKYHAELVDRLSMTQRHMDMRASTLRHEQQETAKRIEKEHQEELSAVSSQVAGVKTDLGSVKSDVNSTKAELDATKAKLERAIGDLGLQSGLIARTREQLDELRHKTDRNYYEFSLGKQKTFTPVGTISLQLKKVDSKHGKFTLDVLADDLVIEKKDRNVNEPLQFYCGREHQLFELVVNSLSRNKVAGYLSTPKTSPQPFDPVKPAAVATTAAPSK